MAYGRRGTRGQSRGKGGQRVTSGQLAGTNSDLKSQSGGIARTFQATNGSAQNGYGKGSTGRRSVGRGGYVPGLQYNIFGAGGDSTTNRSGRRAVSGVAMKMTGNTGRTNVSVVMPKALGPKGFGGNYRLSKGY